jgi:hypothetical protein
MTRRIDHQELLADARIVPAPVIAEPRACTDHSFELPTGIYVAMGLCFAGFAVVLATAFQARMAVSYGIVFAFIAAFFAVPAVFVRTSPGETKALDWFTFRNEGIMTATGRTGAAEAATLVLTLPFLILCWAIAVATIAALV